MSDPDEVRVPDGRSDGLPHASARRPGPFSSVPVRDYVTDVLAIVLLCVALGLGWDARSSATDRVEVVLTTVVSILSLSLFYLARAGAMPPGWTNRTVVAVRALANVPYLVVVLVYVVLDVVAAFDDGRLSAGGGLGPSVAIGLAGVALVVAPRAAEIGAPRTADLFARALRTALVALLVMMLLLQAVGVVSVLVDSPSILRGSGGWAFLLSSLVRALLITAVAAVPLLGTVLRSAPWRALLVTVAVVAAFDLLFLGPLNGVGREVLLTMSVAGGSAALVLLPAAGALAVTPAARRILRAAPLDAPERPWFTTASLAWLSTTAVAALYAVVLVLWLVGVALLSGAGVPAWFVVLVVVLVFAAVAAVIARTIFFGSPSSARVPALAVTGVVVVLGVVAIALVASSADGFVGAGVGVGIELLLVAFGLPVLAAVALLVPAPVRAWFVEHADDEPLRRWRDDDEPTFAAARAGQPPVAPPYAAAPATEGAALDETPTAVAATDEPARDLDPVDIDRVDIDTVEPDETERDEADRIEADRIEADRIELVELAHEEPADEPTTAHAPVAAPVVAPTLSPEPVAGSEQDVVGAPAGDPAVEATTPSEGPTGSVDRPVPHSAGTAVPAHPFTAEQALDPTTDLEVLAAIAAQAPELRVHLAANPSTYPDLLHWLGQLGDPQIDAELARRGA
ncbi:hypothetical protein KIN34_14960 [Cellulomonas sp. DKR-3]|uniref:Uncharacterized protein n=1 Tax=Cellulomonas fulva TaxID=2835530 RepID=A0ABS5U2G5_9CELL|nr:hypothetical protein [Cellulomonas fulva]MBT0995582.1 hypothetical protein [Cellulomonas fulva]